ncbi:MAG TPA: hypothetical protein VEI01_06255 [Terriglobales bacterium]|nr:hypothetical protein [Terriglobales bacterium]
MLSKPWITLVVGAVCILLFCSRSGYGESAVDPCSLLSQAQVSAALGADVAEGKRVTPKLCDWSVPGQSPGMRAKKVTITMLEPQGFSNAKLQGGGGNITKTPVSGIGDEAVYGTTSGLATTLSVRKGSVAFTVHVWGFDEKKDVDQIKAKEKTLALEALSKL